MATEYPIILAHGICRFDVLLNVAFQTDNQDDDRAHYFKGIRSALRASGFEVFHSGVGWASSVENRARALRDDLERFTDGFRRHPKVHLIGHSMGGLDARHMILAYRMHDRVASLTTVGTPHRGSSFADWVLRNLRFSTAIVQQVGLDLAGIPDLTTLRCASFNEHALEYERANGVRYRTWAGIQPFRKIFTPLKLPYAVIQEEEGANDGLVSRTSAAWRDDVYAGEIDADHLNQVGWWDMGELLAENGDPLRSEQRIRDFYVDIAHGL